METTVEKRLTHQDYRQFACQTDAEIEASCSMEVFHASGPGGQGVNTADSAVRMRHEPTGIVVVSRESRSQLLNRKACVRKLRTEFRRRSFVPKKRKATKPTKASVRRRLDGKRRRSDLKASRRRVEGD